MNSKALKPKKFRWMYEDEEKNLLQNLVYLVRKYLIWPVKDNYRIIKERSKRCFQYAKFGLYSYDWDMAYVYEILNFKLKRLYRALENGTAVQQPEDMAALKELIKITFRLHSGNYDRKYHREHSKKWGEIESETIPCKYDKNGKASLYEWKTWRPGTKNASEEVKEQERKEFMACYEKAEEDRCKDIDRMAELLKKYATSWWD